MPLKITEKIIRENAFQQKEIDNRVKFSPDLSANWPSNNRALVTSPDVVPLS